MRMPVMDGYEATRVIKSASGRRPPVVMALTASAFEHDRAKILQAGCDDFLRKPVKESEIFEKMAGSLGVRFVYSSDTESAAEPAPSSAPAVLPADLDRVPAAARAELRAAALQLNPKAVTHVLDGLRAEHAALADALCELVSA